MGVLLYIREAKRLIEATCGFKEAHGPEADGAVSCHLSELQRFGHEPLPQADTSLIWVDE